MKGPRTSSRNAKQSRPRSVPPPSRLGFYVLFPLLLVAITNLSPPIPLGQPARGEQASRTDLPSNRPNVLLLISDDQAFPLFTREVMPNIFSQLVDKGVLFNRAYVNTSLCCPSRAQILTGLWGHHTGVDGNDVPLSRPTIVEGLHELGYRTSMTGKYLNSASCDPRPEFDQFVCQGSPPAAGYRLANPRLDVNGTVQDFQGFAPDIHAQFTSDFIAGTPADQPFFAIYSPTTPHLPADDPRCRSQAVPSYRPTSFDEDTFATGKPQYMQRAPLTPKEIADYDSVHEIMTQASTCLDMAIGTLLSSLGDREQDTLVIYLSDNGYLYGEHRRSKKQVPYEESVRVPFVVRFPPALGESPPFASEALVQNVDIAATIADLLDIQWGADGRSFLPVLTGEASSLRDAALIEHCQGERFPCEQLPGRSNVPSLFGLASPGYKYVEYVSGEKELYDLVADPYEISNHAGVPAFETVQAGLATELAVLTAPPPTDTTVVTGPQGLLPPNSTASFTYFSQSRFSTYECRLDRDGIEGTWGRCDGQSITLGPLLGGNYVFNVRGTDENGVTDPSPDTRSFSVAPAQTAPTTTITSGPPDPNTETSATFTFSADEDPVTFGCSLDGGAAAPCTSPATYNGLTKTAHTFSVFATDASGNVGNAATWTWTVIDVSVSVQDFLFSPKSPLDHRGGAVRWTFSGPSVHTATDASGMNLFNSGPTAPGGSYTFTFTGAGKYKYGCTIHPMAGSIRVPIDASPAAGSTSTTFTVTWAAASAPAGYLYDVQIRRPGATRWVPWKPGQTIAASPFIPDAGPGSYGFRGRLRSETNGASSKYSAADFISVT